VRGYNDNYLHQLVMCTTATTLATTLTTHDITTPTTTVSVIKNNNDYDDSDTNVLRAQVGCGENCSCLDVRAVYLIATHYNACYY
jgi:hypothetical protein